MPKLKKSCPCGKTFRSKLYEKGSYNVGALQKESGWLSVFGYAGSLIWLCPDCSVRAKALAKELVGILKTSDIYFESLTDQTKGRRTK